MSMAESKLEKGWNQFAEEARSRYGVVAYQNAAALADAFEAGFKAAGGSVPKKDEPKTEEPETEPGPNVEEVTVEEPKEHEAPAKPAPRSNRK